MKDIKPKIQHLLQRYPHLRDSDERLIATFWMVELGGQDAIKQMTAYKLLESYVNKHLTSAESIRRMRQKIQEQVPELRGKTYLKRKAKSNEIRNTIHSM